MVGYLSQKNLVADFIINTANTLSPFTSPGQDKRFPITSSESVFTFGDFKIQRGNIFDNLELSSSAVSFSNFSTLENFSASTIQDVSPFGTTENELNPDVTDPNSYSYFGSFYTRVSRAINKLIDTFPYAILSYNGGSANTLFNYTYDSVARTSMFRIPLSSITNQGNVIYASGVTDSRTITLYNNFNVYGIQFSGTANTHTYHILNYSFTTGVTGYMEFKIDGLLTGITSSSTQPIYVRPSTNNYSQYQRTISNLEYQLAFDGNFKVPDPDNDSVFLYQKFEWPRNIDGFNIDTYGSAFESYKESILKVAARTDEIKTSWMVRTMLPEQFAELDTDTQIYQKLTAVYAEEFDNIKAYIDNLAFMHSVSYSRAESIPDKMMYKLSRLLSFDFHDAFSDSDVFEYFLEEDEDGKTLQDYNLELWRKMLKNIVWLYKKKGTRDALMFIFKLMGAPDCLVSLNEFVYKVNKINNTSEVNPINLSNAEIVQVNEKVAEDGYINYDASSFVFQEGGLGRGNGQKYIDQWEPEFNPIRTIDNVKIFTGDTEFGTRNILNSKEAQVSLDPAGAIECDIKEWYELGQGVWNWGTTGFTASPFTDIFFSGMTVPFEWTPDPNSFYDIIPPNITAMTISQWLDYVYTSNVNPTNRKTSNAYSDNMSQYMSLKKIYMTYMLWTNNQPSNRLTFGKLERLLELLERNFFKYLLDFVPATTVLEHTAVVYRNTMFERQKFVYPEGLNRGSEFQKKLPDELIEIIDGYSVNSTVNNNIAPESFAYSINNQVVNNIISENVGETIVGNTAPEISSPNYSFTMVGNFYPETEENFDTSIVPTTVMNYTSGNTLVSFYGVNNPLNTSLGIGSITIDNTL